LVIREPIPNPIPGVEVYRRVNAKDVIKNTINMGDMILNAYIGDLSDSDLMQRPEAGANHLAWQLGHLVSSERKMLTDAGFSAPPLPDGFDETYSTDNCAMDDASKFHKKDEILNLMTRQREASMAALDAATDADLAKPTPESMQAYAKTNGDMFNLLGIHVLMHVGQFVPVRRRLEKPITI
jgi:hypothetical protein